MLRRNMCIIILRWPSLMVIMDVGNDWNYSRVFELVRKLSSVSRLCQRGVLKTLPVVFLRGNVLGFRRELLLPPPPFAIHF